MSSSASGVLTAGVVGCGRIGADYGRDAHSSLPSGWLPYSHAAALAACDGIQLDCLCDTEPDRLEAAGRRFGVNGLYRDLNELLIASSPDILAIATRTPGRSDLIEQCLSTGVRALHVEKPLGRNITEVNRILTLVRQADAILSYGTTRRGMDAYRAARKLIDEGAIGTVRHICIEHGRDLLLWGHPHSIDLALFFAGTIEVDWLQASCEIDGNRVADNVVDSDPHLQCAYIQFSNGIGATVVQTGGLSIRITGEGGLLIIDSDGKRVELRSRFPSGPYFAESQTVNFTATESGTLHCMGRIREALNGMCEPLFRLEEIEIGMRLLLACAWSSLQDGRRVQPNCLPEDFTITGRYGDLYA